MPAFTCALLFALGLVLASCGGASQAEPAPSVPPPAAAPAPAALTSSASPTAATPPAGEAAPASSSDAPPTETAPPTDVEPQRQVKYFLSPEGLRVEILGVKFVPKVQAVRTQAGFVVKVTLAATAGEARSVLSPKNGPLAFAGSVTRAGRAEPEHFGDRRDGDGEEPLGAGTTVNLMREWPGNPKLRPLGNGDSLELDVGLWGLGTSAADRRAVKQFLRVKAKVETWKARASVEPPPSMKGK